MGGGGGGGGSGAQGGGGAGGGGSAAGGSGGGGVSCSSVDSAPFNPAPHLFSQRFGDGDYQGGRDVAVAPDDSVFMAVSLKGSADFGGGLLTSAGDADVVLARFDPLGNHVWSQRFGGVGYEAPHAVAHDGSGGVVVVGSFDVAIDFGSGPLVSAGGSDIFVARFDGAGALLWSKRFGDPAAQNALDVAVDSSGNIVITGIFYGTVDFGGGALQSSGGDVFVVALDASGNHVWSKGFGDAAEQFGESIAVDAMGNVLVAGTFQGVIDFGSGPLAAVYRDVFLAKLDPSGAPIWGKRFGDGEKMSDANVGVDAAGDVFLAGDTDGTVDFGNGPLVVTGDTNVYVAKFDPDGSAVWSKTFGDMDGQEDALLAVDAGGSLVLAGELNGTIDFGGGVIAASGNHDTFVAKLDGSGGHLYSGRYEGQCRSVAFTNAGALVLTGDLDCGDFGGGPLVSAGGRDAYLAEIAP